MRWTLSLGGGADLGALPAPTPLLGAAGRFELATPTGPDPATRGAVEIAVEYLSSPEFEESGWKASVDGAGVHGSLCGLWQHGWFGVDLCAGLWLRTLPVSGEGAAATLFEPARATIGGWSTRAAVRAQLTGPWSVFAGLHALAPFGMHQLTLAARPEAPTEQLEPPFFNTRSAMNSIQGAPSVPLRLDLYDVPVFAAVLVAGVTFAL